MLLDARAANLFEDAGAVGCASWDARARVARSTAVGAYVGQTDTAKTRWSVFSIAAEDAGQAQRSQGLSRGTLRRADRMFRFRDSVTSKRRVGDVARSRERETTNVAPLSALGFALYVETTARYNAYI